MKGRRRSGRERELNAAKALMSSLHVKSAREKRQRDRHGAYAITSPMRCSCGRSKAEPDTRLGSSRIGPHRYYREVFGADIEPDSLKKKIMFTTTRRHKITERQPLHHSARKRDPSKLHLPLAAEP